jgi:hypothetical protein
VAEMGADATSMPAATKQISKQYLILSLHIQRRMYTAITVGSSLELARMQPYV